MKYVDEDGVNKLGELVVDMSDLKGGKDRKIFVEFSFGKSDFQFKAIEPLSGKTYIADIKFEGKLFEYNGPKVKPVPQEKYHM